MQNVLNFTFGQIHPFSSCNRCVSKSGLTSWNCPRSLLSPAISRSPWHTFISTCVWPSAAVEKT